MSKYRAEGMYVRESSSGFVFARGETPHNAKVIVAALNFYEDEKVKAEKTAGENTVKSEKPAIMIVEDAASKKKPVK